VERVPYQAHSETSKAAAASMVKHTPTIRARVLAYIKSRGADGATDSEIQQALGLRDQTEVPRRIELMRTGEIANSGKQRKTASGRNAVVWVLGNGVVKPIQKVSWKRRAYELEQQNDFLVRENQVLQRTIGRLKKRLDSRKE
jgi:hypothetical protein